MAKTPETQTAETTRRIATSNYHHQPSSDNNIGNMNDQLSQLPDGLLTTILAILPIKNAASTSILSKRWHNLWTQIPHFSFNSQDFNNNDNNNNNNSDVNVLPILDKILPQLKHPKLASFKLSIVLKNFTQYQHCNSLIQSWVPHICTHRKPEEIELHILTLLQTLVLLPAFVFQCNSLVTLDLGAERSLLDYKLPDDGIVTLNNLKKLKICINDSQCEFVAKLVSSCPVLEELHLICSFLMGDNFVEIFGLNLRVLKLDLWGLDHKPVTRYSINAPMLQFFVIQSCTYASFSIASEYLSELVEANVWMLEEEESGQYDHRYVTRLLNAVSCVRSLVLRGNMFDSLYKLAEVDEMIPVFYNLTELCLYCEWSNLMPLLQHCPNLEVLIWYLQYGDLVIAKEEEIQFWEVPMCFPRALKSVTVYDLAASDHELHFLEFVLSNARSMEELEVGIHNRYDVKLPFEWEFCKVLFSYPRVSENCVVKFCGGYLSSSSDKFDDDILDCKLCFKKGGLRGVRKTLGSS